MQERQVCVTFEPSGRRVYVLPGTTVLETAARAGLILDTPCGGAGTCGKCRVRVAAGAETPCDAEGNVFDEQALSEGWRLACQTHLHGDMTVQVPDSSLFGSQHQILETSSTGAVHDLLPGVRKVYVELPRPSLEDDRADFVRLVDAVGAVKTDLGVLRELSRRLRENAFKGTAVLTDHHLIDFEAGDTTAHCYGAAFDIGTTTLAASLLDLRDGSEKALVSRMNPQTSFGDDVLSRIVHASSGPAGLAGLQDAIIAEVAAMLEELCQEAQVDPGHIYVAAFSGNTTMQHLFCGIDPSQLGQVPFVPVYARGLRVLARELGLPINRQGIAYVFPVIGGFVGGDTVSGILATRLPSLDGAALMVDIGTNGEIVLAHDGQILAASTAAGPAFEGARISCGMRATRGAVEKVVIGEDVEYSTIGDVAPLGLCGSGLIDLVAQLLKQGIVSPQGRLLPPEMLPPSLPEALKKRVVLDGDGGTCFVIENDVSPPTLLTQQDIRELQLASGAIRAGIALLLKRAGLDSRDLATVLIAGGFGSFIRRSNARRIGLLPADIDASRIHYVGNASLSGATWVVLSTEARRQAEAFAEQTCHVELSSDEDFAMAYAQAMLFPEA